MEPKQLMSTWLGDGSINSRVAREMWMTNRTADVHAQPSLQKIKHASISSSTLIGEQWMKCMQSWMWVSSALETTLSSIGYSKVCARQVSWMFTLEQKDHQCCQSVVRQEQCQRWHILGPHHHWWCEVVLPLQLKSKQQLTEWHHSGDPATNKFKIHTSAAKMMSTVF